MGANSRIEFTILLAGIPIGATVLFPTTREFCREYLTGQPPAFSVEVTPADIAAERQRSAEEDLRGGIPARHFSDPYLETLALYRHIAEGLLPYDTLLFHGSALALDGGGYLFTAKSGTGKSTHARLWREAFGGRVFMVNDDKPLLRITPHGVWACGTPWDGKHHLSRNTEVPLKALCLIRQGAQNHIEPITRRDAWAVLMQQCYRPEEPAGLQKVLTLLDRMTAQTALYHLCCNMQPEAAQVAYAGMKGDQK